MAAELRSKVGCGNNNNGVLYINQPLCHVPACGTGASLALDSQSAFGTGHDVTDTGCQRDVIAAAVRTVNDVIDDVDCQGRP
jgi:hypothetical protein